MKILITILFTIGSNFSLFSQVFVQKTGIQNVLNGVDIGIYSCPVFADIDNDLDFDLFAGTGVGTITYYKNTGSPNTPVFTLQSTANNPFGAQTFGTNAHPTFIDIDGDEDLDAFVGGSGGRLTFFRNNGSRDVPLLTLDPANNPLSSVVTEFQTSCAFVDIDADQDLDVFIGGGLQTIAFYRNTGDRSNPFYTLVDPAQSPLQLSGALAIMNPKAVDADGDGDFDLFFGSSGNAIHYYQNTGTKANPVFVRQTGTLNPLNSVTLQYPVPAFTDLDSDGDLDVIIGQLNGTFSSFQNNAINLPLKLVAFAATASSTHTIISWTTAEEQNTAYFNLETSADGIRFAILKSVPAAGSGNNSYSARDLLPSSTRYYRLKMIDKDASFTYSAIVKMSSTRSAASVKIFPNPVGSTLHLQHFDTPRSLLSGVITDLSGRRFLAFVLQGQSSDLPVGHLPAGNYLLTLSNGAQQRIVKK